MKKEVVGNKLKDLRNLYKSNPELYRAFCIGFAAGQCEKVYLDVCPASMFRPAKEDFEWYKEEVAKLCKIFDLTMFVCDSFCEETPKEIWVCKIRFFIGEWLSYGLNSPEWHKLRAKAVGIPEEEVDVNYHLRKGYGEK